jgi:hypothetical protein
MNKALIGIVAMVGVLILLMVFLFTDGLSGKSDIVITPSPVHSFEECVARGNPVMESHPRQCKAGNITFVEEVAEQPPAQNPVVFENVTPNQVVTSPLNVKGQVIGAWCFEASCPIEIRDANGKRLGQGIAQLEEWMTEELVPFEATITFSAPSTETGHLVLSNSNPSGLPENDKSAGIPVRFK